MNAKKPQLIFKSNGCHDCPFNGDSEHKNCVAGIDIYIEEFVKNESRNQECPLILNDITVIEG